MAKYFPLHKMVVVVALSLFAVRSVSAQDTGAIGGTVTASTGDALAGVTIRVANAATGLDRTVVTQTSGNYVVLDVPPGRGYEISAVLNGFATMVRSNVAIAADEHLEIDFRLYAATSEALVVTGSFAATDHDRSTVQQTVPEALVRSLPLPGRDFIALASLTPGFTGNPIAPSPQGQLYSTNNVLVDGASHYSKWRGAPRTFYSGYGLETIRTVQVLSSQYSSEFGEALATVTVAATNSGTDTFHGAALFFGQAGSLNDIPAFAPRKLPFQSERYGATLGGPIRADRAHFFASFEGWRQRSSNIVVSPEAAGARARNDQDERLLFVKTDQRVGRRDLVTTRYNGQWFDWHNEPGGLSLPGTGTGYVNNVHTFLATDTMLVSSQLLNEVRVQFARYQDVRRDLNPTLYVSRAGYSASGGTLGPRGFGADPENTWEAQDTVSYRVGLHALKFGGGVKGVSAHNQTLPFGFGAYLFAGPPSLFPQPFAFVQGVAPSEAAATADPRSLAANGFLQDDWSIASNLTLNLGLRYDVERISNLRDFDAPTDKNNIQPRVGLAWALVPGRTVLRAGTGIYAQQHLFGDVNRVQLEGADGTATLTFEPGAPLMPVYPRILATPLPVLPPRDIYVTSETFKNPHSVQGTIGIQHTLLGMVVAADVVYLSGRDLVSLVDTNAPSSNPGNTVRTVAQADGTRPLRPVSNGFRKIIEVGNEGESSYRALQVKADRSLGALQALASYTWARARDRANGRLPEDSRNLDAEEGRSDNDIRHNLSVGLTWQLPLTARGVNGMTLSAMGLFRSDKPYTITWGDDRNGTAQYDARPGGRNTGAGGTFKSVDLALAKRLRVAGKTIDARAEAFNLFSTTNYDEYIGALNSPFFGQPVTALPRRRLQLGAAVRF